MGTIWEGFTRALQMIFTADPLVVEITWRSLRIVAVSSSIAFLLIALPLALLIHFNEFPGKRLLTSSIYTLFAMPTVVVGLVGWLLLSRTGPLGLLDWLFTPQGIIFGQVLLITPVMLGLIIPALRAIDRAVPETAMALGAGRRQMAMITVKEARFGILTALIMGIGRAVSEIGVSMIIGGNIAGHTRTLTTAIVLETNRGETELAIALGIVLIVFALVLNTAFFFLQREG